MRRFGLLLTLLGSLLIPQLRAEEILLKDGTKITGKLTGVSGDTFQVKTAYGDISIPRSEVVTISFPENAPKGAETDSSTLSVDEELKAGTYTNRTAGFQVTVPSGWTLAPELRKSKDVIAALKSPDEALFFMVTPEKFSGTLATYKVLAETQFKANFSSYQSDSETEAQLDGRKGVKLVFRGKSNVNQAELKFLVYILPYDGRMVRLSFFTLDPLFAEGAPVFEKMAASYHSAVKGN